MASDLTVGAAADTTALPADAGEAAVAPVRLVAIGASAGGLEALRELLESLPPERSLAYVVAQHVSPTHVSMLLNLLAPCTALTVCQLSEATPPQGGAIYLAPPNHDVLLRDGCLCLAASHHPGGPHPSANRLFQSMADELGEAAIGIVLSGTGTDGSTGLKAIKAAGGVTLAQEPESARYDGMPRAAIQAGSVDLILRPAAMGAVLERLVTQPGSDPAALVEEDRESDEYTQIANLVRLNTTFRLSDYKAATVQRRIARRMNLLGLATPAAYVDHLRRHKDEALALMRDTFISVTSFFRDAEAFAALGRSIGTIVRDARPQAVLRCWVPACASGEEAYSLAMQFEEALIEQGRPDVQYLVFASDLDDVALEQARQGLYPAAVLEGLSGAMRNRYTEPVGAYYRVLKELRSRMVFARQNLLDDPPFARLDLVSCRNLLIYLNPPAQRRALEVIHYALNPGGQLFLGRSETADASADLFLPIDPRARLYQRQEGVTHYALSITQSLHRPPTSRQEQLRSGVAVPDLVGVRAMEALVERFAPPSVVIDEGDRVVHFQGDLKPHLQFPKGRAEMVLFDLLDPELRAEIRALVFRCRRDLQTARGSARPQEIDGRHQVVTPVVAPLEAGKPQMLLVSFQTTEAQPDEALSRGSERDHLIIGELEEELASTRSHLNVIVEELQSLNEELQSANEELQSTNEELQTSNEELQATNEELLTVNEELQIKSGELEKVATDLRNVEESLAVPLLVVDTRLQITRANAACGQVIASAAALPGSSLLGVHWRVDVADLAAQVGEVIRSGGEQRSFVRGADASVYRLLAMPYRRSDGSIDGAVLLFENVTTQQAAEDGLRESEARARMLVDSAPYCVLVSDERCTILDCNAACERLFGYRKEELIGQNVTLLMDGPDAARHDGHVARYLSTASSRIFGVGRDLKGRHKDGHLIDLHINAGVQRYEGQGLHFIAFIRDLSDSLRAEAELRLAASVFNGALDGIFITAPDGRILKVNPSFERITGYARDDIVGRNARELRSERHDEAFFLDMDAAIRSHGSWQGEVWYRRQDGGLLPSWLSMTCLRDARGEPEQMVAVIYDISEQKLSQERIHHLAHFDALTGLPNRFLFRDRLGHALAQAKRQGRKLALLFIDLDNFKHINDTYGHPVGDQLLCLVAERLKGLTRESDTVARLSGDEFTLLIEDASQRAAVEATAQKLLKVLAEPFETKTGQLFVSASIGIAMYPKDGDDLDTLLRFADLAMYRSKDAGRNQLHFYSRAMSAQVEERMTLRKNLRLAMDHGQLSLQFQPVMDVAQRRCIGAEALARWEHASLGWIPPAKFVAAAEDSGLIHPLGEWILRSACRTMSAWLAAGLPVDFLSVNVSGRQIAKAHFLGTVQRILEETGCPPQRIMLELTESYLMHESAASIAKLVRLREMGFGIAIDDFGTGYSSLSYLKRLPVTKLKLDQSFVHDLPSDVNDAAIARAVLRLGETLGLEVVAEGVETEQQHVFILSEGCSFSQGFLYGRPMVEADFVDFLSGHADPVGGVRS
ncbi:MAG TPA: EAL domain-containing protein [Burkholderiaceae bacterium]|nr:EAL domain-containing protein [Burkholderiaceae bacterium]HNB43232.1 EAL domain-containing protein [Burkholderiaceae bacterium]HNG78477.1 EAL domain-containing protein [Burkholderiaceae bacterium]